MVVRVGGDASALYMRIWVVWDAGGEKSKKLIILLLFRIRILILKLLFIIFFRLRYYEKKSFFRYRIFLLVRFDFLLA